MQKSCKIGQLWNFKRLAKKAPEKSLQNGKEMPLLGIKSNTRIQSQKQQASSFRQDLQDQQDIIFLPFFR